MTAKKNQTEAPITQDELDRAAQDENQQMGMSVEVLIAQNNHLRNRVVLLRAALNRTQTELDEAKKHLPKDYKPRTAKKTAKKVAAKRR